MKEILEILKYVIPSFIVFLTSYFILRAFVKKEVQKDKFKISQENYKLITPMRLQAYERFTLFLERISPESLVLRLHGNDMNVQDLQTEILINIRKEFEHNIVQQIYVSPKTWLVIKRAKEQIIEIVNMSASELDSNANAFALSKKILNKVLIMKEIPTNMAINFIKREMNDIF
ncbi:MAG: hypothetical protein B6I24_00980 [Bacteroidetes bacterium 4572_128]|nr:MAG: hypothetical protein B6I24_00980 [Bacteroidetes bacterium 4572_128]